MPIMFNAVLAQNLIDPAATILLRHQDQSADPGRTPYDLWRDNRPAFELYQSIHALAKRQRLSRASTWASFVGTPDGATMFAGLYAAKYEGLLPRTPHGRIRRNIPRQ